MTPERGFAARWLRLFPFPLKIHFKGRQLPAGKRFFKISFALVIRVTGFWQSAGERIFSFTPYNTGISQLDGKTGIFRFVLYYGQKSKMPSTGAKNFSLTYYYNPNRAKWPGTEPDNKKSSKSFSDLLLSLAAPVAAGIQF